MKIVMLNYTYCHPEKIEFFEDDEPLHDIGVEEDHSFLVEGGYVVHNSASGTGKKARNRETQAILSLRGKVRNTAKITLAKALENKEVASMVLSIGVNVGRNIDLEGLRYDKIVLMCDADEDGDHITCLLLTFIYKHLRPLIDENHIYIADLPLYRVMHRGKPIYLKDEAALQEFQDRYPGKLDVTRFKGLGELNADQLEELGMNPATRRLVPVTIEDAVDATNIIETLMGSETEGRRKLIEEEFGEVE